MPYVLSRDRRRGLGRGLWSQRQPQRGAAAKTPWTTSSAPRTRTTTAGGITPAIPAIRRSPVGRSWPCEAKLAGLNVGETAHSPLELAAKWLDLVKTGPNDSQFQYQPGCGATPSMTAVGLLGRQYLHAKRDDPLMTDGVKYLMNNMPDMKCRNIYYWYYATQVLHNCGGKEWDTWNAAMRDLLISAQTSA